MNAYERTTRTGHASGCFAGHENHTGGTDQVSPPEEPYDQSQQIIEGEVVTSDGVVAHAMIVGGKQVFFRIEKENDGSLPRVQD